MSLAWQAGRTVERCVWGLGAYGPSLAGIQGSTGLGFDGLSHEGYMWGYVLIYISYMEQYIICMSMINKCRQRCLG